MKRQNFTPRTSPLTGYFVKVDPLGTHGGGLPLPSSIRKIALLRQRETRIQMGSFAAGLPLHALVLNNFNAQRCLQKFTLISRGCNKITIVILEMNSPSISIHPTIFTVSPAKHLFVFSN